MKHRYRKTIPLLLAILCTGLAAHAGVKIAGTIQHKASDSIRISYNDSRLVYNPREFYARVDKKGNFSLELPIPGGVYTQAEIKHGNHLAEIILRDGDSLSLTVNEDRFDSTIHYTGRGGEIQNFIAQHSIERGRANQYVLKVKSNIEKTPEGFLKAIAAEKANEDAFLEKYRKGLPEAFVRYWQAYYKYYNYFFMQQYPQMHEMFVKRRYTDTIPEANYAVTEGLPYAFDDELIQVPSYLLYLTGIFETRLLAQGYGVPTSIPQNARMLLDSVAQLAYTLLPPRSAEYYIAQGLYARIKAQDIERTHTILGTFKKHWPESEYLPALQAQVAIVERMLPGQPAPALNITTIDGKQATLADMKGKAVYVVFWASWCRQCVAEMRQLEHKVKDVLKNKPVAFVYVSIDDDTATAKLLLAQLNLTGNVTYTKGAWYAPEVAAYGVQALPAYFLIGPDGNFAVRNPPTPQQPTELIVAISKLY